MARAAQFGDDEDDGADDRDAPNAADMARFGGADDSDEDFGADDYDDAAFDDQPGRWGGAGASKKRALLIGVGALLALAGAVAMAL